MHFRSTTGLIQQELKDAHKSKTEHDWKEASSLFQSEELRHFTSPFIQSPTEEMKLVLGLEASKFHLEDLRNAFKLSDTDSLKKAYQEIRQRIDSNYTHELLVYLMTNMNFQPNKTGVCYGACIRVSEAHLSQLGEMKESSYDDAMRRFDFLENALLLNKEKDKELFAICDQADAALETESASSTAIEELENALEKCITALDERREHYLRSMDDAEQKQYTDYIADINAFFGNLTINQDPSRLYNRSINQRQLQKFAALTQSTFYEELSTRQICQLMANQLLAHCDIDHMKKAKAEFYLDPYDMSNQQEMADFLKNKLEQFGEISDKNKLLALMKELRVFAAQYHSIQFNLCLTALGHKILIQNDPLKPGKDQTSWRLVPVSVIEKSTETLETFSDLMKNSIEWQFANMPSGLTQTSHHVLIGSQVQFINYLQELFRLSIENKTRNFSMMIEGANHAIALCFNAANPPATHTPTIRFFDTNKPQLKHVSYTVDQLADLSLELMTSIKPNVMDYIHERALSIIYMTNPENSTSLQHVTKELSSSSAYRDCIPLDKPKTLTDNDGEFTLLQLAVNEESLEIIEKLILIEQERKSSPSEKSTQIQCLLSKVLANAMPGSADFIAPLAAFFKELQIPIDGQNIANSEFLLDIYYVEFNHILDTDPNSHKLDCIAQFFQVNIELFGSHSKGIEILTKTLEKIIHSPITDERTISLQRMASCIESLDNSNKLAILMPSIPMLFSCPYNKFTQTRQIESSIALFKCLDHLDKDNLKKILQPILVFVIKMKLHPGFLSLTRSKILDEIPNPTERSEFFAKIKSELIGDDLNKVTQVETQLNTFQQAREKMFSSQSFVAKGFAAANQYARLQIKTPPTTEPTNPPELKQKPR